MSKHKLETQFDFMDELNLVHELESTSILFEAKFENALTRAQILSSFYRDGF